MHRFSLLLLFISFLTSSSFLFAEKSWVDSPYSICQEAFELCVVGRGKNEEMAKEFALKEMAGFFGTTVFSKSQLSQKSERQGGEEESSQDYQEEIRLENQKMLQGVLFKEKLEKEGDVYVLASLDKVALSKRLEKKITDIDNKLISLKEGATTSSNKKMSFLYDLRNGFNDEFHLLRGRFVAVAFTAKDLKKLHGERKKNVSFYLQKENKGEFKELLPTISKAIRENGHLILNSEKMSDYLVHGRLMTSKQFLAVSGFEKYLFQVVIKFVNQETNNVLELSREYSGTGRTYRQIKEKAFIEFKKMIEEGMEELDF